MGILAEMTKLLVRIHAGTVMAPQAALSVVLVLSFSRLLAML